MAKRPTPKASNSKLCPNRWVHLNRPTLLYSVRVVPNRLVMQSSFLELLCSLLHSLSRSRISSLRVPYRQLTLPLLHLWEARRCLLVSASWQSQRRLRHQVAAQGPLLDLRRPMHLQWPTHLHRRLSLIGASLATFSRLSLPSQISLNPTAAFWEALLQPCRPNQRPFLPQPSRPPRRNRQRRWRWLTKRHHHHLLTFRRRHHHQMSQHKLQPLRWNHRRRHRLSRRQSRRQSRQPSQLRGEDRRLASMRLLTWARLLGGHA